MNGWMDGRAGRELAWEPAQPRLRGGDRQGPIPRAGQRATTRTLHSMGRGERGARAKWAANLGPAWQYGSLQQGPAWQVVPVHLSPPEARAGSCRALAHTGAQCRRSVPRERASAGALASEGEGWARGQGAAAAEEAASPRGGSGPGAAGAAGAAAGDSVGPGAAGPGAAPAAEVPAGNSRAGNSRAGRGPRRPHHPRAATTRRAATARAAPTRTRRRRPRAAARPALRTPPPAPVRPDRGPPTSAPPAARISTGVRHRPRGRNCRALA